MRVDREDDVAGVGEDLVEVRVARKRVVPRVVDGGRARAAVDVDDRGVLLRSVEAGRSTSARLGEAVGGWNQKSDAGWNWKGAMRSARGETSAAAGRRSRRDRERGQRVVGGMDIRRAPVGAHRDLVLTVSSSRSMPVPSGGCVECRSNGRLLERREVDPAARPSTHADPSGAP